MSDKPPAIADLQQAAELFREFLSEVESLYGSFLDSYVAIRQFRMFYESKALPFMLVQQEEARRKGEPEPVILHGRGDPNQPESRFDHSSTISEFMERIRDGGADQVRLSQAYLVLIYQRWEDHYRGKIARSFGIPKNDVLFPFMGEIRHLRHSVVHNKGVALPEVAKCQHIKFFKPGDQIFLDGDQFAEVVNHLRSAVGGAIRELTSEAAGDQGG